VVMVTFDEMYAEITSTFYKRRKQLGYSRETVAELCGTSKSQVFKVETGVVKADLLTLFRMFQVLKMDMSVVFTPKTGISQTGWVPGSTPSDIVVPTAPVTTENKPY